MALSQDWSLLSMVQQLLDIFQDYCMQFRCDNKCQTVCFSWALTLVIFLNHWLFFKTQYFCNKPILFCNKLMDSCHWHSALWSSHQSISCTLLITSKLNSFEQETLTCFDVRRDKCLSRSMLFNIFWLEDKRNWFHWRYRCALTPIILLWRNLSMRHRSCSRLGGRFCSFLCNNTHRGNFNQYPQQLQNPSMLCHTFNFSDKPYLFLHTRTYHYNHLK